VLRVRVLGDEAAMVAAAAFFGGDTLVASVEQLDDGWLEIAFTGDDDASAALLSRAVGAGHRVAVFSRAASDLEELFLQVTAREASDVAAAAGGSR
jgi:hypothetical protein